MSQSRPRIVVIGAGIIGTAITYNLGIRGADVLLLDAGPSPGDGVTGRAFGWINVVNGTPGRPSYDLLNEGFAEYRQLRDILPAAFLRARPGSLLWKASGDETESFARLRQSAGERIELWQSDVLQAMEPALRRAPDCAVFSPDDLALDPRKLAADLVDAAVSAGASTRFGENIVSLEVVGGKVSGLRMADGPIDADVVVLAAGAGVGRLAGQIGVHTGLETSSALILRYACRLPVTNRILCGPRLEIRQTFDNTLVVAESYDETGHETDPTRLGEQMLAVMRDELDLPDDVSLQSAEVGRRPIFSDGMPRFGFRPEIGGLYIAVGHPGVILAPLIGRRAAEDILQCFPFAPSTIA